MALTMVITPFVFANPEALRKWRKMIQTPVYRTNLFGLVADEAHVVLYVYRYLFTKVLCDDLGKLFHVVTVLCESLVIYEAKIKPFFYSASCKLYVAAVLLR